MAAIRYIGTTSERKRRFEWRIDNFLRLLEERTDEKLYSKGFEFARNQWFFEILPNINVENPQREPWVELRLIRKYSHMKDNARACLGIRWADGQQKEVCNRAQLLSEGETEWGKVPIVEKRYLLRHHQQILHEGQLVVFCYLTKEPIEEELSSDEEGTLVKQSCQLLYQDMLTMFEKGLDTDITIKVGDCEFQAHQTVLVARSPVFRGMLTNEMSEKKSSVVTINDCEPLVFHQFLHYIYTGKVKLFTADIAISLFIAADKYYCPDLIEQCVQYLESNMTTAVVLEVLKLTSLLENKRLYSSAMRFFSDHMYEIVKGEAWIEFLREKPYEANTIFRDSLQSLEERNVFII